MSLNAVDLIDKICNEWDIQEQLFLKESNLLFDQYGVHISDYDDGYIIFRMNNQEYVGYLLEEFNQPELYFINGDIATGDIKIAMEFLIKYNQLLIASYKNIDALTKQSGWEQTDWMYYKNIDTGMIINIQPWETDANMVKSCNDDVI